MSQTFFQYYCSVCKSHFNHPREKEKNNHTRNYSNFLNCCGIPVCDNCNQKWFRVRCNFCKEITMIHEIKHTCIHHYNFRKNHYLSWDNCVTHCISFTRLMQLPLYNQFLKLRDEYVLLLKTQFQIEFVGKLGYHNLQQRNADIFAVIFKGVIAKRFLTS